MACIFGLRQDGELFPVPVRERGHPLGEAFNREIILLGDFVQRSATFGVREVEHYRVLKCLILFFLKNKTKLLLFKIDIIVIL
jgi:hypothetical protein